MDGMSDQRGKSGRTASGFWIGIVSRPPLAVKPMVGEMAVRTTYAAEQQ